MTITMVPSSSPELSMTSSNTPPPSIASVNLFHQMSSKVPLDFSPLLIAMVVVVATAFLIVTYSRIISRHVVTPLIQLYRQWRRRRRRRSESSLGDIESPPYSFDPSDGFHVFSPYGLDESVIKTIPLSVYTFKKRRSKSVIREEIRDCAVCLLEFEENDYVRTLPVCSHAFHVDCIDIWLKSHANCPLCRTVIIRDSEEHRESPFVPLMAARLGLRPSLAESDANFQSIFLEPLNETEIESDTNSTEIENAEPSPRRNNFSEDRFDFALKRSYSFGYERNCASERIATLDQPAMTSPRRFRSSRGNNKRNSPFTKHRVFSFRYRSLNGTIKSSQSPFFRRRSSGFFPLSESNVRYGYGYGYGSSTRRSISMTSPMFNRSSVSTMFSSSRLRCGDPDALLSPDR